MGNRFGDDRLARRTLCYRPPDRRRRRIPLEQIERAEPVTYRPLLDYGGCGIRRGRDGWCYNVSGNRGVRLELAGGERLLIGSPAAEELARAIRERKALAR